MILSQDNYIEKAEKAILALKNKKVDKYGKPDRNGKPAKMVTTSKLRNILGMAADIYNEVLNCSEEQLSSAICERIDYMQIRIVYEYGRDTESQTPVKSFLEETQLLECVKEIKGSKSRYILFNRYMEALVAFHKFYGGKEN